MYPLHKQTTQTTQTTQSNNTNKQHKQQQTNKQTNNTNKQHKQTTQTNNTNKQHKQTTQPTMDPAFQGLLLTLSIDMSVLLFSIALFLIMRARSSRRAHPLHVPNTSNNIVGILSTTNNTHHGNNHHNRQRTHVSNNITDAERSTFYPVADNPDDMFLTSQSYAHTMDEDENKDAVVVAHGSNGAISVAPTALVHPPPHAVSPLDTSDNKDDEGVDDGTCEGQSSLVTSPIIREELSLLPPHRCLTRIFGRLRVHKLDGILYLRFHQLTMVLLFFFSLMAVGLLVPIYLAFGQAAGTTQENTLPSSNPFDRNPLQLISAGNLPLASPWLWATFTFAILLSISSYFLVHMFLNDLNAHAWLVPSTPKRSITRRTIMLTGLDQGCIDDEMLTQYFVARFPGEIEFVHIVKDMSASFDLMKKRLEIQDEIERLYIIAHKNGTNLAHDLHSTHDVDMDVLASFRPFGSPNSSSRSPLSTSISSCCHSPSIVEQVRRLQSQKTELERDLLRHNHGCYRGTGMAFIVFRNVPSLQALYGPHFIFEHDDASDAAPIMFQSSPLTAPTPQVPLSSSTSSTSLANKSKKRHSLNVNTITTRPMPSKVDAIKPPSSALNAKQWKYSFAPSPDDIIWENLHISRVEQWLRWVIANICLLLLVVRKLD